MAGDFTGDGHLDLAVANSGDNTVSVLLGNGDGTFQPQVTYAVGQAPQALVAGDFTGDGHLDLAVANGGSNTVSMLLGKGDGTFAPQVTYAVGSESFGNRGGRLQWRRPARPRRLREQPSGWRRHSRSAAEQGRRHVRAPDYLQRGKADFGNRAGDFTGDGRLDLAVTSDLGYVSVLLGNGDGTFQAPITYAVGGTLGAIVAGDFNGDGRLDLAVAVNGADVQRADQRREPVAGRGRRHLRSAEPDHSGIPWGRTQAPSWRATSPVDGEIDLAVTN